MSAADSYSNPQAPTGPFADLVPQAAAQFGVPEPVMHWVGFNENGWRQGSNLGIPTSSGQAAGPWQFMPGTAQQYGVDPLDPRSSTFGAAKLLRDNFDKTGSWEGAISKYGTFSTGVSPALDLQKKLGFRLYAQNVGLKDNSADPIQLQDHPIFDPNAAQQQAPPQQMQQPMPDPTSADQIALQQAGNQGTFSANNLLRMAAGFAGKQTFGQAISGAAGNLLQGQQTDQQMALQRLQAAQLMQTTRLDQQKFGLSQQEFGLAQSAQQAKAAQGYGQVVDRAKGLLEIGMPWKDAITAATAGYQNMPGYSGMVSQLQSMPAPTMTGGKQTAGETLLAPDGTQWQERNRPYGPPVYYNMQTGEQSATVPQGAMRPQDSYFKQFSQADGGAEVQAQKDAQGTFDNSAKLNSLKDLIPQISPGQDLGSVITRNMATLTGQKVGATDPAAIQEAQSLFSQMNVNRIKMLGGQGLGPIRVAEVNALKAAGNNWQQSPAAMNALVNYGLQQDAMKRKLIDEWQQKQQEDPTVAGRGFRAFQYNWAKQNAAPSLTDPNAAATGPVQSPAQGATDGRPALSSIFGK